MENTIVSEDDEKIVIKEPSLSTGDDVPLERYKYENPLKYDEITLARRKLEVNRMMTDYPHMCRQQIEDVWDYVHIVGEDKVKENLENGFYDQKLIDRDNQTEAKLTVRDI